MANRHEKRKAEAIRRKQSAQSERRSQLDEAALRMRRHSSVGASIGEIPDSRGGGPQNGGEIR